ncbi:MAG: hypothetical protein NVS2B14_10250 [Chamaesiphon sp.]
MLLISIALHGLILLMPLPSPPKQELAKKQLEKVKITQLPNSVNSPSPKLSIKPSPKPSLKPIPRVSPIVHRSTPPLVAHIYRPSPQLLKPLVSQSKPQPLKPPVSKETPKSIASPIATTPAATPTPALTPTSTPTPETTAQDPFADFPRYPNAQPGSSGLLPGDADKSANSTGDKLAQVVEYFKKELETKKFSIQPTTDEATIKVYQVSKGSTNQFLHLISRENNTVIVLAPQPLDLEKLKTADVQQQSPEERAFDDISHQVDSDFALAAPDNDLSYLVDFSKFPDAPSVKLDEGYPILGVAKGKTSDELLSSIQSKLSAQGFELSQVGTYGRVPLYKVSNQANKSFTRYMSIVPTPDGKLAIFRLEDSKTP